MGAQTSRVPLPEGVSISWYRTKLPPDVSKRISQSSDVLGAIQTLGFLAMLALWALLALMFHSSGNMFLATFFTLMYGMQSNFLINGMHELGHGFVFRTKCLNSFFMRVISFLGWLHPDMFFSSHLRHHRYTQNFPHDQENGRMPVILTWKSFVSFGFVNVSGCYSILSETIKAAFGIYPTGHLGWLPGWEEICYPSNMPQARVPAMRWAQFMLLGHGVIGLASVARGWWLVPVLLSLGPFYNGWLFWLCNSTQHVGMHHGDFGTATVNDFRLTTRTFYVNGLVGFWYWHMNYHTEHHMFAAVPCYHLSKLHEAIKYDLPATPNGLVETWQQISEVLTRQAVDPAYCQPIELPKGKQI